MGSAVILDPPTAAAPIRVQLTPGRLFRLARKELRETLRDRRTIVTLVLMPVLVYPLLGLTFQRFLLSEALLGPVSRPEYVLGFANERQADRLRPFLSMGERLVDEVEVQPEADAPTFKAVLLDDRGGDPAVLVREGLADVAIALAPETDAGEPIRVSLVYDSHQPKSAAARREIEIRLHAANELWLYERLNQVAPDTPPLSFKAETVKGEPAGGLLVAAIVPLVLLLMTVTGAVYPAIDLTAGERERGTLEAVVATPIPTRAVLFAKYVAVFCVAMLTAAMNIAAMTATTFAVGLDGVLFGGGMSLLTVAEVFGLLVILAAFFSAVLLLVTSFARSFKEAQAYLIPVMLVALAPGIASLMPTLELTPLLAAAPLLGIILLARDLLTDGGGLASSLIAVTATLLYAVAALLAASRVFGADAVLAGSGGTWGELLRRDRPRTDSPPPSVGLLTVALLFPVFLLVSSLAGRLGELPISLRFGVSAGLTLLLFGVIPLLVTRAAGAGVATTFRLTRPPLLGVIAAGLLGVSLWPFVFEVMLVILSGSRFETLLEKFREVEAGFRAAPPWLVLLTLAVAPAVCEEWCFRGLLLSSLRGRMSDARAIVVSAAMFGAFHVVMQGTLLPERFVPSALMGLVLGFVCVRTGSLWPGVLLHALHNGLLDGVAIFRDRLTAAGWGVEERSHLPAALLLAAGVGVLVGGGLLVSIRQDRNGGTVARPLR